MSGGHARKSGSKAQNLLLRFPVTDLARAVALTGASRRSFLANFVEGGTTLSYVPTRDAATIIYGVQKPLFEIPPEPWAAVERHLRAKASPEILEMNLDASRALFDLIRPMGYAATECESQVLRVRLRQIVHIGLNFYVTQGERLIFQFPHPRKGCLSESALLVLGSVIHHAYVQGDFALADVEIADLGRAEGAKWTDPRWPRVRRVPRDRMLSLAGLTEQINDVYDILRELSAAPPS